MAERIDLLWVRPDLPDRHASDSAVQPFLQKFFALPSDRNTFKPTPSRPHKRGASRSSRTLRRDAVDATAAR
jgi:hypothetical protein